MGQGMVQMQQQLQQMQAQAADAQQIAAAQQMAQAAQGQAQNAMNGNAAAGQGGQGQNGNGNGNKPGGQQGNNGQWGQGQQGNQPGQPNNQNGPAGPNGGGQAAGDRTYKAQAPYTVKPEMSPSQDDEKGRILANSFVKDDKPLKGSSSASLKDVAAAAEQEQTDEIDQDHVSRQAEHTVHEYFRSMQEEK